MGQGSWRVSFSVNLFSPTELCLLLSLLHPIVWSKFFLEVSPESFKELFPASSNLEVIYA
jgi:hypothetical protein